jgi:hypothetical protein
VNQTLKKLGNAVNTRLIFIFHASKDDGFVKELHEALEGQGLTVWVDSCNLRGGAKLAPEIEKAMVRRSSCATGLMPIRCSRTRRDSTRSTARSRRRSQQSDWQQFVYIALPLLKPALLVALIFRTLDAFRVFDLIFVMTGGGPGTATEPMALYTFTMLLQYLRFGLGAALSTAVFLVTFALSLIYIRVLSVNLAKSAK